MGMSDLQFKSFLRKLITILEDAENAETPEKGMEKIAELKKQFLEDLES